jgi:tetratricopeptide (TPR) repeat protein
MSTLQRALHQYVLEPRNAAVNYNLGLQYHAINNSAAAISFFLRAAELTDDDDLAYTCLLLNAINFRKQGRRNGSFKNQVNHAMGLCPERPEAYFLMSRFYQEYSQQNSDQPHMYHESYTMAQIGLSKATSDKVNEELEYFGDYVLEFQKAVAAWWIGKRDESRYLFRYLLTNIRMQEEYVQACRNNMKMLGTYTNFHLKSYYEENYAQAMQDLFALKINDRKRLGSYLEIGSADPKVNSNTYLLETTYYWTGISIEIDADMVDKFATERRNKVINANALNVDYKKLLLDHPVIDYLSLDCDPPEVTLAVLKKIPFEEHIFKCITFEHDAYAIGNTLRDEQRAFLKSHGYILVADNIGTDVNSPFEDWWVHSSIYKDGKIDTLVNGKNKRPIDYIYP